MKKYVTGFLFSQKYSHLVLIKKLNPHWQWGLYNGVGGKIKANENSRDAMVREFKEETGLSICSKLWTCYAQINRPEHYHVDVYFACSDLAFKAKTIEQESVHIIEVDQLPRYIMHKELIPNLSWLIPLALDTQADFTTPILINEVATERLKA